MDSVRSLADRFWERVNKDGPIQPHMDTPCWEWTRATNGRGYGKLKVAERFVLAHRLAFELSTGQTIQPGFCVCHRCDHPSCCNPAHLFLGTQADNLHDMFAKGRGVAPAKLTSAQVAEIRALRSSGLLLAEIAARFGVNRSTIGYVVRGDTWRPR